MRVPVPARLLLATLACLVVAACGGSGDDTGSAASVTTAATTTTAAASPACADAAALKASVAELTSSTLPDAGKTGTWPPPEGQGQPDRAQGQRRDRVGPQVQELDAAINEFQTTLSGVSGDSLVGDLPTIVSDLKRIDTAWTALEGQINQTAASLTGDRRSAFDCSSASGRPSSASGSIVSTMTAGLLERDAELRRLRESLRGAGLGQRPAAVSGEAGIGKTSLVRAFTRERPGGACTPGPATILVAPTPGRSGHGPRDRAALAAAVEPGRPGRSSGPSTRSWPAGRRCCWSRTSTGPTTPPLTCSATWPGGSRSCRGCWCRPTARTSCAVASSKNLGQLLLPPGGAAAGPAAPTERKSDG